MSKKEVKRKRWFAGDHITPDNEKDVYQKYKQKYLSNFEPDEELGSDKWDEEEIDTVANAFAKYEVKKQKAHLKAFLKGKQTFKFLGREFPVLASTSEEEVYLSDFYPEMKQGKEELEILEIESSQLPRPKGTGLENESKPTDSNRD